MNPVQGFAMASWERGYGDFVFKPDMATLRRIPWLERTALVVADIEWQDGRPVAASPRQILRRQLDRLAERGLVANIGSELEFILFRDTYDSARAKRYHDLVPANAYNVDYSILGTTMVEDVIRPIRLGMAGAGHRGRGLEGRVQLRPARGQLPLLRRARRWPTTTPSTRTAPRRSPRRRIRALVHGQVRRARGQLVPHPLLPLGRERAPCSPTATATTELFRHFLAGQLAGTRELTLCFAPNVNSYKRYAWGSFAPTTLAWGVDNRTCAFRVVGHGPGLRVESRLAGADTNPYLAFAAMIAAGLHGIENELDLEDAYGGNAYDAHDKPRVPSSLGAAIDLFDGSALAREAFGRAGRRPLPALRAHGAQVVRGRGHRLGEVPQLRTPKRNSAFLPSSAGPAQSRPSWGARRPGFRGAAPRRRGTARPPAVRRSCLSACPLGAEPCRERLRRLARMRDPRAARGGALSPARSCAGGRAA